MRIDSGLSGSAARPDDMAGHPHSGAVAALRSRTNAIAPLTIKSSGEADIAAIADALLDHLLSTDSSMLQVDQLGDHCLFRRRYEGGCDLILQCDVTTASHLLDRLAERAEPTGCHLMRLAGEQSLCATLFLPPAMLREEMADNARERYAPEQGPVTGNHDGLILVCGTHASDRAETMAALLHGVRTHRRVLSIAADGERSDRQMVAALESALAHAPDIVAIDRLAGPLVAQMALSSSLRGHLMIVGVDAPDTIAAILAMADTGVDRFGLARALRAVVMHRPVRRLCPDCREPAQADGSVAALLGFEAGTILYTAVGCAKCDGTGYCATAVARERIAIDDGMRRLIHSGGDASILARHAFLNVPNLGASARQLARSGVITAQEALRVTRNQPAEGEFV